jgi:predicted solute-binding protein
LSSNSYRVGAVSYFNTLPLVWGMLHGPERERVRLSFSLPSVCAEEVERGEIEIGLVPVAEIARQGLEIVPGTGISCRGAVRSILLVSRVPWRSVRTLATDSGSRTSVELAQVILRERFGVDANTTPFAPDLDHMLSVCDAALVIGDAALRISPAELRYDWLDLGEEWFALTGLPMVFAAWAGKQGLPAAALEEITRGSYRFGAAKIKEIVDSEHAARRISKELAERYLRQHIRFELGAEEVKGLEAFLELAGGKGLTCDHA